MTPPLPPLIERILFTEEQIQERIRQVAAEVTEKYRGPEFETDRRSQGLDLLFGGAGSSDRDPN